MSTTNTTTNSPSNSKGSHKSNGFSVIKSRQDFEDRFPGDINLQEKNFLKDEFKLTNADASIYVQHFIQPFFISRKVVYLRGEKILYFPIYEILKYPLFCSNLKLSASLNEEEEEEDEEEDEINDVEEEDENRIHDVDENSRGGGKNDIDPVHFMRPSYVINHEGRLAHANYPSGPVEFVIREEPSDSNLTKIMFIIEVKARIEAVWRNEKALWQLLSQMRVALLFNDNFSTQDGIMHGALTNLYSWIFVMMKRNTAKKRLDIKVSGNPMSFMDSEWTGNTTSTANVLSYIFQILARNNPTVTNCKYYLGKENIVASFTKRSIKSFVDPLEMVPRAEVEEERKKVEEERKKVEEERKKVEEERKKVEEEFRKKVEEERKKVEEEGKKVKTLMEEKQKLEKALAKVKRAKEKNAATSKKEIAVQVSRHSSSTKISRK